MPQTPDALIGGFMRLIGQDDVWENIKKGNAIQKAWAWFQGTLDGLLGFARSIPQTIIQTLASLTITDLVTVVGAFRKIGGAFLGIAAKFGSWALGQVVSLLEILFSVVAPGVLPYLKKAKGAFVSILTNPIGFVGNLVRAAKLGFQRFAGNIVKRLKTALIKWLVGPLADAGVYIPKSFSLIEIVKLVLSVLGLTWKNIRAKLVKIIPEPVLAGLEKTAGILVTLVKEGPAAAWKQIKSELTELKEQLISQLTQMVSIEIVKAAVMKLVSMINPAGAVVQAIIAIYNTISFFIEKARQIAAVVGSFINSIAAIASSQVNVAATRLEHTLARTLTVVISFLAKFAGIGGIPKKLVGIVKKIRKPIDKGLDKIVAWLGKMLKKMVGGNRPVSEDAKKGLEALDRLTGSYAERGASREEMSVAVDGIRRQYNFKYIKIEQKNGFWEYDYKINPQGKKKGPKPKTTTNAAETLVPNGSWIKNLKSGSYERVTKPRNIIIRVDGVTTTVNFMTEKAEGGSNILAYKDERSGWIRSNFSHPSKFVIPSGSGATFVLKPAYRGSVYIRPNFYSDTSSSRKSIVKQKLPSLLNPANPGEFLSQGDASAEAAKGYTQRKNGMALVPISVASPDHTPPIAAHWSNNGGNNTNQTSRKNWNTSLSTYRIMSRALNISLGSGGINFTEQVGVNFKGPGE